MNMNCDEWDELFIELNWIVYDSTNEEKEKNEMKLSEWSNILLKQQSRTKVNLHSPNIKSVTGIAHANCIAQ